MPRPQDSVRVFAYSFNLDTAADGRVELARIWNYTTCKYFVRHDRAVFVRADAAGCYTELPGYLPREQAIRRGYGLLTRFRLEGIAPDAYAQREADRASDPRSLTRGAATEAIRQAARNALPGATSCSTSGRRRWGQG